MKNKICVVEMCKSQSEIQVRIRHSHTRRNIKVTNEIICDCAQQQTAARKLATILFGCFVSFQNE